VLWFLTPTSFAHGNNERTGELSGTSSELTLELLWWKGVIEIGTDSSITAIILRWIISSLSHGGFDHMGHFIQISQTFIPDIKSTYLRVVRLANLPGPTCSVIREDCRQRTDFNRAGP